MKKRVTAKKFGGDDSYSWAVFLDGRPVVTSLGKSQVAFYKAAVRRQHKITESDK